MRFKRFLAVILGAALLTGCATSGRANSSSSSSSNVESSSEYSSEESSSSSSAMSSSSKASSTSSIRIVHISSSGSEKTNVIVQSNLKPWIGTIYDGETKYIDGTKRHLVEFYQKHDTGENYTYDRIRFYVSSNRNEIGEIIGEYEYEPAPFQGVSIVLRPGTNYYRIQYLGENVKSRISDPYEYTYMTKENIPRYTHTFVVDSYFQVIPDYTKALKKIEKGQEPETFEISVVFTCPGCGRKITSPSLYTPQYSKDSRGVNAARGRCGMSNCPCGKQTYISNIETHAIRIS